MTWIALIGRNLLRRPARTAFTVAGVGLGVGLIVALLSITNGVHATANDLVHVGRADFGLFQADVSDFTRSLLPESLAAKVAADPAVSEISKVKVLVSGGWLVFGLEPSEFAYRRFVILRGRRGAVLAGDHSGTRVGQTVTLEGRRFTIGGIYHSGDRFEDLGIALPLHAVESLAQRPGEITSIGVAVKLGENAHTFARRLERRYPGVVAIDEPGKAIEVDTSSRLIITTGWIISALALIVGGIGVTNTMAMTVFERTHELGILRAVGWRSLLIGGLIVSETVAICLLALGVGLGLGVLAAEVFVAHSALSGLITPYFSAGTFAWGLAFALGVGLLGAAYPTWRAVRLAPIEALRHE